METMYNNYKWIKITTRGVINSDIGLHNLSSANDYLNRDIKSFVRKYNANHKKLQIELASLTAEK